MYEILNLKNWTDWLEFLRAGIVWGKTQGSRRNLGRRGTRPPCPFLLLQTAALAILQPSGVVGPGAAVVCTAAVTATVKAAATAVTYFLHWQLSASDPLMRTQEQQRSFCVTVESSADLWPLDCLEEENLQWWPAMKMLHRLLQKAGLEESRAEGSILLLRKAK